jgi:hypothetical protein
MPFDYHEFQQVKHTAYSIRLNEIMLNAFKQFAHLYIANNRKGIKKGKIGLRNAQYSNFQNLRHFGIIRQEEKGSEWHLTPKGEGFFQGQFAILSPAGFLNGETLNEDHPAWDTYTGKQELIYIDSSVETRMKQRPEYQEEKFQMSLV